MVGLLAPVPEEHLISGLKVIERESKVAFGTRAWEVFRTLDALSMGEKVDVLIYASWPVTPLTPPQAKWTASYVGCVEAKGGSHPAGLQYRPETTTAYMSDNQGHWAMFWEVVDLRRLTPGEHIKTGTLIGLGKSRPYTKHFIPEGPILIDL